MEPDENETIIENKRIKLENLNNNNNNLNNNNNNLNNNNNNNLLICKYGINCYRKNSDHFLEFYHPIPDSETEAEEFEISQVSIPNPTYFLQEYPEVNEIIQIITQKNNPEQFLAYQKLESLLNNIEEWETYKIKSFRSRLFEYIENEAEKEHDHGFFEYLLFAFFQGKWGTVKDEDRAQAYAEISQSKNDSFGLYAFGICYDIGIGLEADSEKAVYYFTKSGNMDHPMALNSLGLAYLDGIGIEQNIKKGIDFLKKAANLNCSEACFNLVEIYYYENYGKKRKEKKIINFLQRAEHLGHSGAIKTLADYYLEGKLGLNKDIEKALRLYTKAATLGQDEAMYCLGKMYETGRGTISDPKKAFELYKEAFQLNNIHAIVEMGKFYLYGTFVEENSNLAEKLLSKANRLGDKRSKAFLGEFYVYEKYKRMNYIKANRLFEESDCSEGFLNLSKLYQSGKGVPQSYPKSIKWIQKAAENGNLNAIHELANAYQNALGVQVSSTKAAEWYQKAADQGYVDVLVPLGILYKKLKPEKSSSLFKRAIDFDIPEGYSSLATCYLNGLGEKMNREMALELYDKAMQRGLSINLDLLFNQSEIDKYRKNRARRVFILLLCVREKVEHSLFFKDFLPLDIFKLLVTEASIPKLLPSYETFD